MTLRVVRYDCRSVTNISLYTFLVNDFFRILNASPNSPAPLIFGQNHTHYMLLRHLLLILSFSWAIHSRAQTTSSVEKLTIGEVHTLHSTILNEDRILNIYLPPNYDANSKYSVIYLLDGSIDEDFLHITGLVQFFNLMFAMPDVIVVGIANVDRKRDYTFPTMDKKQQADFPTTGHSADFIRFLQEELQPYIESKFQTGPNQYLIGQSLGGLIASELLLHHTAMFTHYLIVSPSLWWDNESLLEDASVRYAAQTQKPAFIYIAAGADEPARMKKDASRLYDILKTTPGSHTETLFNLMDDENHATILHNSIYQALIHLFPYKD